MNEIEATVHCEARLGPHEGSTRRAYSIRSGDKISGYPWYGVKKRIGFAGR